MKNIDKYLIFQILKIVLLVITFIPFAYNIDQIWVSFEDMELINLLNISYQYLMIWNFINWIIPTLFFIIAPLSFIYKNKKLDIASIILFIFVINSAFKYNYHDIILHSFNIEFIYIITIWVISIAIKKGLEYFNNKK